MSDPHYQTSLCRIGRTKSYNREVRNLAERSMQNFVLVGCKILHVQLQNFTLHECKILHTVLHPNLTHSLPSSHFKNCIVIFPLCLRTNPNPKNPSFHLNSSESLLICLRNSISLSKEYFTFPLHQPKLSISFSCSLYKLLLHLEGRKNFGVKSLPFSHVHS